MIRVDEQLRLSKTFSAVEAEGEIMLKRISVRFVDKCANVCILTLLVVFGAQLGASAVGHEAPPEYPGGSTFAHECVDLLGNPVNIDAFTGCLVGKCDDLHPDDDELYRQCVVNGANWLAQHTDETEPMDPGVPVA